jgi:hypothetical protein
MSDNKTNDCILCQHYRPSKTDGHPEFARCGAPQNFNRDLTRVPQIAYCSTHRNGSSNITCGPSGLWFEPKIIQNRPQELDVEKVIFAASLDGYDLSDLVDAITAKAREIAPDFEFDTNSLKDALCAIEDNPKTHETEPYDEQDQEDRRLHV